MTLTKMGFYMADDRKLIPPTEKISFLLAMDSKVTVTFLDGHDKKKETFLDRIDRKRTVF
jgi:hypothetical protein